MKKYLLGTSALVAAGMVAGQANAADKLTLGVGGFMEQFFGYVNQENDPGRTFTHFGMAGPETEIHFKGSINLDNGMKVTLRTELEANSDQQNVSVDETWMQISSDSLGLLDIGSDDVVADLIGTGYPKVGIGITDIDQWIKDENIVGGGSDQENATNTGDTNDAPKVSYFTPADWQKATGLQASVSYAPKITNNNTEANIVKETDNQNAYSFGVTYSRNLMDVDTYIAYSYFHQSDTGNFNSSDGVNSAGQYAHNISAQFKYGPWILGGAYSRYNDHGKTRQNAANSQSLQGWSYNVGVAYTLGRWQFGLAHGHTDYEGSIANRGHDKRDFQDLAAKYDFGVGFDWRTSLIHAHQSKDVQVDATTVNGGWGIVTGFVAAF
jgi:outer membrane protein OmpU